MDCLSEGGVFPTYKEARYCVSDHVRHYLKNACNYSCYAHDVYFYKHNGVHIITYDSNIIIKRNKTANQTSLS